MYQIDPGRSPLADGTSLAGWMAKFRILLLIGLMVLTLVSVLLVFRKPVEEVPQHWKRATLIELGDSELEVLRTLTGPLCQGVDGEVKIWIYAPGEEGRAVCVPREGDLVVRFDAQGQVSGYDPEFGIRTPIRSDVDHVRFRRVVAADEKPPGE